MKKTIKNLLVHARRVYRYRKDALSIKELGKLQSIIERLEQLSKTYKSAKQDSLMNEITCLDQDLKSLGGKIYPKPFGLIMSKCLL